MTNATYECVYQIVCRVTGKRYIGSAQSVFVRFQQHKGKLQAQKHCSQSLQRDYNIFGESNFLFQVIENHTADRTKMDGLYDRIKKACSIIKQREKEIITAIPSDYLYNTITYKLSRHQMADPPLFIKHREHAYQRIDHAIEIKIDSLQVAITANSLSSWNDAA
jgi:group I intron endonuclease